MAASTSHLKELSGIIQAVVLASQKKLMKCSHIAKCPEHEKYVVVIFDEMHICADLVYNKHNGELVGFCNLGEINNCLLEVEKSVEENNPEPVLAKSMLVFMGRGTMWAFEVPLQSVFYQRYHGSSALQSILGRRISS